MNIMNMVCASVRGGSRRFLSAALIMGLLLPALTRVNVNLRAESPTQVRVWRDSLTLPTYRWEEDINPKFWALEGGPRLSTTVHGSIIYPYVMQDQISREKVDQTYHAVFLENEYLRVICLPELGGRIHSVLDKTTGEEMFHLNRVIKPGMIAMRGAWISGGIEWNPGPHGHTVTCLSPVNVASGDNPDGSAFLEISNTEQIFRTQWSVRLTLHPGRSFLDEEICLYNPSDGTHPYYFWNCTAFPNRTGTRFIFPMSLGTDHNAREFFRWPIHEGRDLTWLKNYETSSSIFAVQCTHDFFGAYDVDSDRGLVQWADHCQLSGKKAWTWGEWDAGRVAEQDLTDEDGPYIEVQSGPLPTQSDYGRLAPRQRVAWQEWWYPAHGLGDGFEFATRDVVANVVRPSSGPELRILGTAVFPKARCVVKSGGKTLVDAEVTISPGKPTMLTIPAGRQDMFEIEVTSAKGKTLAKYRSPLEIPHVEPPDPAVFREKPDAEKSADELYHKGEKFDLATDRAAAQKYYEMACQKDPAHAAAHRALAILDVESGNDRAALEHLQKSLASDPENGWTWYYLALCQWRLNNPGEALHAAEKAAQCRSEGVPVMDLVGRIKLAEKDLAGAEQAFRAALAELPEDSRTQDHLMLVLARQGRWDEAKRMAASRLARHPTAVLPAWITAQGDSQAEKRCAEHLAAILGDVEFEVLEVACVLMEVNLTDWAESLIRTLLVENTQFLEKGFMPCYYLAWLASRRNDTAATENWLKQAAQLRRPKRFASRLEETAILRFATERNPSDSQAWLQLGCLLANLGQIDAAVAAWQRAAENDPKNNIAWRNLAVAASCKNDLAAAETFYRRAIEACPSDQTLYRDLAEVLIAARRRPEAIALIEKMPLSGMRRTDITVLLAQAYFDEGQDDDCLRLLENTPYFTNWEGQDIVWRLFHQAHLRRGQARLQRGDARSALADFEAALTYPANLHVGRTDKPIEAPAQYWRGRALASLGRYQEARNAWITGAELPSVRGAQDEYREKCRQALKELPPVPEDPIFIHGPTYRCFKIERDLNLTGCLDDPLWGAARVVELRDPLNGRQGRYRTTARLLYNDRHLYLAFQCEDQLVWGMHTERDAPVYEEECVEAFLCPTAQPRIYYELNVSPRNTVFDALILNGRPVGGPRVNFIGLHDYTCAGLLTQVRVNGPLGQPGASGWSVEYAIPFSSLVGAKPGAPQSGEVWYLNLFRIDAPQPDKPEHYSWVPTEAIDFHRPWCFGILKFD